MSTKHKVVVRPETSFRRRALAKLDFDLKEARFMADKNAMRASLLLHEAGNTILKRYSAAACNAHEALREAEHAIEVLKSSLAWLQRELDLQKEINKLEDADNEA